MSEEEHQDIEPSRHRLAELEVKKIRTQIWEHRVRTLSIILGILGALRLSGFP